MTPTIPTSPGDPTARSLRVPQLDAARGVAIVMMALDHASFYTHVDLQAERYIGRPYVLGKWHLWVLGLFTNLATPLFWFISGVSLALLAHSSRERTGSEAAVTRFILMRALVLVALDATLIAFMWSHGVLLKYEYEFNMLSALAVALLVISVLRRWSSAVLATIAVTLLVGFQALRQAVPTSLLDAWGFWPRMWVDFDDRHWPQVWFPVLGWFGLMLLGYALGPRIMQPPWQQPRRWVAIGVGMLIATAVIRFSGGYGSFFPWHFGEPARDLLMMCKGPPSLDYLLFNGALGAFVIAALRALGPVGDRPPFRWLKEIGGASLFAYVIHFPIYRALGPLGVAVLARHPETLLLVVFLAGLAIMLPLTRAYRRLKLRHPQSVLHYL